MWKKELEWFTVAISALGGHCPGLGTSATHEEGVCLPLWAGPCCCLFCLRFGSGGEVAIHNELWQKKQL